MEHGKLIGSFSQDLSTFCECIMHLEKLAYLNHCALPLIKFIIFMNILKIGLTF